MSEPKLRHAPDLHRYEISVDGALAGFAEYEDAGRVRTFTHTVVEPAFEGQGLASKLARHALADVRAQGLTLVPACQFIRGYIERHPQELDLLSEATRREYGL